MRRKYKFCIAIACSILMISGCREKKTPEVNVDATVVTPTEVAKQSSPTKVPVTEPVEENVKDSEINVDSTAQYMNQYANQTLIPMKSDGSQWNPKELDTLLKAGKIVEIPNGTEFTTDISNSIKVSFDFQKDINNPEEYTKYTLTVNNSTISNETSPLTNKVYMASLNGGYSYQFIIQEYGYEVHTDLHIFSYNDMDKKLNLIGTIPGDINDLVPYSDGTFTSLKSASCVETWWYNQRYMISKCGYSADYESQTPEVVVKMAPEMHPVGTQVITKMDLPLLSSQNDVKPSITVPTGTNLVLCSCDDTNWLYVSTSADTPAEESYAGYLRLSGTDSFLINESKMLCIDVFDNLFFAG